MTPGRLFIFGIIAFVIYVVLWTPRLNDMPIYRAWGLIAMVATFAGAMWLLWRLAGWLIGRLARRFSRAARPEGRE